MLTFAVYLNWQESILLRPHQPFGRAQLSTVRQMCRKPQAHGRGVRMVEVALNQVVIARAYCAENATIGHACYEGLANIRRAVGIERFECAQRYRRHCDYDSARRMLNGARELFAAAIKLP